VARARRDRRQQSQSSVQGEEKQLHYKEDDAGGTKRAKGRTKPGPSTFTCSEKAASAGQQEVRQHHRQGELEKWVHCRPVWATSESQEQKYDEEDESKDVHHSVHAPLPERAGVLIMATPAPC